MKSTDIPKILKVLSVFDHHVCIKRGTDLSFPSNATDCDLLVVSDAVSKIFHVIDCNLAMTYMKLFLFVFRSGILGPFS